MASRYPEWPAVMCEATAKAYLDCAGSGGRARMTWDEWRSKPGFPAPDLSTGQIYKASIDDFLASYFGYADPVAASERELDKLFGT